MKYILLLIALNIKMISSLFHNVKIRGCVSEIFDESSNFRILKIDFSKSCKKLEKCLEEKKDNSECVLTFKDDMINFCENYAFKISIRRLICKLVAKKNYEICEKKFVPKKDENEEVVEEDVEEDVIKTNVNGGDNGNGGEEFQEDEIITNEDA